ncbi:MAG TPA: aldo/keto reductase [Caulobacterales bacterium]|nr:aldo/keto reductase [Caulobacterales bacterium]
MLKLARPGERRLAYGFWRYQKDEIDAAIAMLELARSSGVDHIDTADVYGGASGFGGSESLLGAVRARAPSLFQGAVLATKGGVELGTPYNSARAYINAACDASLRRLGVERIDLYYIHRHDLMVGPAELAGTLDALATAGKIASVGVSNFSATQIDALKAHMKAPLTAHQIEFSPACVEPLFDGTLDGAMRDGYAVAAWSPMAGGRIGENATPEFAAVTAKLDEIAARHRATRAAVALAFLQQHPAGVTPILGTKTPERFRDALAAAECTLTRREWYDIVEARLGRRMP